MIKVLMGFPPLQMIDELPGKLNGHRGNGCVVLCTPCSALSQLLGATSHQAMTAAAMIAMMVFTSFMAVAPSAT
jgi:hypothetical protein